MGKKLGAPPKPPEERKGSAVQIRLTAAEREACEEAAALAGVKLAAWARDALFKAAKRRIK